MIEQQTSTASTLPDRTAYYVGLLEEHEHRGGSLRSFAEARGLSVWTLYGWRRRLGLTRPRATPSSSGLVAVDIVNERPASTNARTRRLRWADLLRRVFAVDVLTCPDCGGARRLIAMITDGLVVRRILDHLELPSTAPPIAPARAPPEPEFAW